MYNCLRYKLLLIQAKSIFSKCFCSCSAVSQRTAKSNASRADGDDSTASSLFVCLPSGFTADLSYNTKPHHAILIGVHIPFETAPLPQPMCVRVDLSLHWPFIVRFAASATSNNGFLPIKLEWRFLYRFS